MQSSKFQLSFLLLSVLLFLQFCTLWAANFQSFLIAHTIDPNAHPEYKNWDKNYWISWMNSTETTRYKANPYGKPLQEKSLNTVLIGSKNDIQNAFSRGTSPYDQKYVWSNRKFESIVFQKLFGSGRWRIFTTPEVYVAVALNKRKQPVHLQAIYTSTPASGNANFPFRQNGTEIY